MNVGEIGNTFAATSKLQYISDYTFMDFDLLIIDFIGLIHETLRISTSQIARRKKDLEEFLLYKKTPLVIFAPESSEIRLNINGMMKIYTIEELLPIPSFKVAIESGSTLNVIENTVFSDFLKSHKSEFSYKSTVSNYSGKSILETPYTKKTLGFYNESCLVIPRFKATIRNIETTVFNDLSGLLQRIGIREKAVLPEWSEKYFLPLEKENIEKISLAKEQLRNLNSEIDEKEKQLSEIVRKKLLFTGTGNHLELEIKDIFLKLGFEILEAEEGRDDLIVKFKEQVAVIEIKGVGGSSAEKHAAQLEKWVNIFYEEKEIKPKGILIVNSFKDEDLDGRLNDTFPHQMLRYTEQREHCLITGIQFLCLYFEILNNPNEKEVLITDLFSTTGIYQRFRDWTKYISKSN